MAICQPNPTSSKRNRASKLGEKCKHSFAESNCQTWWCYMTLKKTRRDYTVLILCIVDVWSSWLVLDCSLCVCDCVWLFFWFLRQLNKIKGIDSPDNRVCWTGCISGDTTSSFCSIPLLFSNQPLTIHFHPIFISLASPYPIIQILIPLIFHYIIFHSYSIINSTIAFH